jgi:hypothetical protein
MKKFFLLTLISVLFLSAFSQSAFLTPEVIAKIDFTKYIDDDEIPDTQFGWWIFCYREVHYVMLPDGTISVNCFGWGRLFCWAKFWDFMTYRGISAETIDQTCEELRTLSDEQIAQGVFQGSVTKKIACVDPLSNGRIDSYFIFQMNWDHDPQKPYNGRAEITILKTNNLGF